MLRAIGLEFQKMRGRFLFLLPLAFLVLQTAWMWWTVKDMHHLEIEQGWQHYLYQLPVLNVILLPVLLAVLASRSADAEHKGNMLRQVWVMQPRGQLFAAKLCWGSWYLFWILAGQLITMLLIGLYKGFYGPLPWGHIGCYLLFTFTVSWCIYLVQLLLSLLVRNQAIAIIVGLAGGFCGLFSMFLRQALWCRLVLWTYYSQLFVCGMNWDRETRSTDMYWVPPNWSSYACLLLGIALTLLTGRYLLERKEC